MQGENVPHGTCIDHDVDALPVEPIAEDTARMSQLSLVNDHRVEIANLCLQI